MGTAVSTATFLVVISGRGCCARWFIFGNGAAVAYGPIPVAVGRMRAERQIAAPNPEARTALVDPPPSTFARARWQRSTNCSHAVSTSSCCRTCGITLYRALLP